MADSVEQPKDVVALGIEEGEWGGGGGGICGRRKPVAVRISYDMVRSSTAAVKCSSFWGSGEDCALLLPSARPTIAHYHSRGTSRSKASDLVLQDVSRCPKGCALLLSICKTPHLAFLFIWNLPY